MLSVKRIDEDGGKYIEESTEKTEGYFTQETEPAGKYFGKAASALGLEGEAKKGELQSLLSGTHPRTGDTLFETNESTVRGYDFTFSASKSVSMLFAVADNKTREQIREAFEASVRDAMERFEDEVHVRHGRAGWARAQGVVSILYEHGSSREGDPQLHIHGETLARVLNDDGELAAMNTREPYTIQKLGGAIFRAKFAERLRDLGFSIEQGVEGTFEVEGVPEEVRLHFSQRSNQIAEQIEKRVRAVRDRKYRSCIESGMSEAEADYEADKKAGQHRKNLLKDPKARQAAAYASRKPKESTPRDELHKAWKKEAASVFGFDGKSVRKLKNAPVAEAPEFDLDAVIDRALAGRSVFKLRDLETELWVEKQFHPDLDVDEVLRLAIDRDDGKSSLVFLKDETGEHWLTKRSLREMEQRILALTIRSASGKVSHPVPTEVADSVIDAEEARMRDAYGSGFNEKAWKDQKRAIRKVLESGDISLVRGKAGTGKTTTFSATRKVYEAAGYRLRGACIAEVAASGLSAEAGIESLNIAQWKSKWGKGDYSDLDHKTVFVIDEAAMVASEDMHLMIDVVRRFGGKIICLGDQGQLQNIASGQIFDAIENALEKTRPGSVATLDEVTRQRDENFRDAVSGLREGDAEAAVEYLDSMGWITSESKKESALEAMAKDFLADANPVSQKLMMAGMTADVDALNATVHEALWKSGKLGEEHLVLTKVGKTEPVMLMFSVGDRIAFKKNDKNIGVKNGQLGEVLEIIPRRDGTQRFRVKLDGGKEVEFDSKEYRSFRHGYCITTHAAQGKTVENAYSYVDRTMTSREAIYVQASRAKGAARLYMTEDERKDIVRIISRSARKGTTLDYEELGSDVVYDDTRKHYGEAKSIREAVSRKDIGAIRRLAEQGADLESREGKARNTALHLAVRDGNKEAVKVLLDLGAFADPRNYRGITPLMDAVKSGDREIVELFVKWGAKPLQSGENGETAFGIASRIAENRRHEAEVMTDDAARQRAEADAGRFDAIVSVLSEAVAADREPEKTAPVAPPTAYRPDSATAPREPKARLPIADDLSQPDRSPAEGQAPASVQSDPTEDLMDGLAKGDARMVRDAIKRGANTRYRNKEGHSVLHLAVVGANQDLVKLAIKYLKPDLNWADADGLTPLHYAAGDGNVEVFNILIDAGADGNRKDFDGDTPFDYLEFKGMTIDSRVPSAHIPRPRPGKEHEMD